METQTLLLATCQPCRHQTPIWGLVLPQFCLKWPSRVIAIRPVHELETGTAPKLLGHLEPFPPWARVCAPSACFLISLIRCQHLGDWIVGRAPLRGRFPFRLSHSLCPPYEWTVECVVFAPRVPVCKDVCRGAHTGSKNVFIRLLMCAVVWSTDLSSQIGWRGLIVCILGKPQSNDSGGVDIFLVLL